MLKSAPIGAILVTYGDNPDQPTGWRGWLLRRAYAGIRKHQRALWPHSTRTDGVHIQIKVSHDGPHGSWVSATLPRVIEHFNPVGNCRKYRLYRYYWDWSPAAQEALVAYARSMVGIPYDTLQLVGIAASEQKWVPRFMRNWLGERLQLPGRKEVCSTLAARAHLAAWYVANFEHTPPRHQPLAGVDPFDCTPAHFEHHFTFDLLQEHFV